MEYVTILLRSYYHSYFLCFLIEFDTNLSNSFAYIILYQYIFYMSL